MSDLRFDLGIRYSRSARGIAIVLLIVSHLFAGALHSLSDFDVTHPSGPSRITALVQSNVGQPDEGVVADHHCHGCFSVSLPSRVVAAVSVEPLSTVFPQLRTLGSDLTPGVDTPPPKHLT